MKQSTIISEPTPPEVLDAISIIRKYLNRGNWEQAIINRDTAVEFRLTNVYEDWMKSLGQDLPLVDEATR